MTKIAFIRYLTKTEESKRAQEQDMHLTKFRENLLTQHSLEIEKIHERHRNENNKFRVRSSIGFLFILFVLPEYKLIFHTSLFWFLCVG
jgi:hypothetical protein